MILKIIHCEQFMTRIQGLLNIRKSNNIGLTSLDQKLKEK